MKFLLYCQHLSGSGHFVRTYEIARTLAEHHEVHIVDGGWPVPRRPSPVRRVKIPGIRRVAGRVVPLDTTRTLKQVMRDRSTRLLEAADRIRPDVLVVEHFPFSKGSLRQEIIPLLDTVSARAFCSLRDIAPVTQTDPVAREDTLEILARYFDALLVHGDPHLTRLEEQISWAREIAIPVIHTGIVSERPWATQVEGSRVVVSAGGTGGQKLFEAVVAAWKTLDDPDRTLVLHLPPGWDGFDTYGPRICVKPYGLGFLEELAGADLSISQAGYSTCANLLETRVGAIVVPNEAMADQRERGRLLAERGLVQIIEPEELDAARLAFAMREAIGRRMPEHRINLDGAAHTKKVLTAG